MKKNVTYFFCDIHGTINGENTAEDYKKFAEILTEIGKNNNSDIVYFYLASTEIETEKNKYYEKFSQYFNDYVKVLPAILPPSNAKVSEICAYLKNGVENYNISDIYFADDQEMTHDMLSEIVLDKYGIAINSIIPERGNNTLEYINNVLQKTYLQDRER